MKDFIILGGGNSGYISALILKTRYPEKNITLIQSDNIGIIGVGEGSTEQWKTFLEFCDISPAEMIKKCGSTFKLGIYYRGWTPKDYVHIVSNGYNSYYDDYFYQYAYLIANEFDGLSLSPSFFNQNKFPKNYFGEFFPPINQFHFDTYKLNCFLMELCKERGIEIVTDDIVDGKINSESGDIDLIISKNGESYQSKFFIDCTGFKRKLITDILGVNWISYSKYFRLNSAIAFPTNEMEEYNAYTLSHARNAGWSWHIPVQGRTGNGYVFSDEFISFDEAHQEIEKEYGEVEIVKKIKFDPGRIETFWYKNCMSVGLASNFLEPLEATSIASVIQQMFCFISFYPSNDKKTFNGIMTEIFENISDYVLLHYLVDRDDTPFWKNNKQNLVLTDSLESNLETFKYRLPQINDFKTPWKIFGAANYILALNGLNFFNSEVVKNEYEMYLCKDKKDYVILSTDAMISNNLNCEKYSHKELINLIKEK